MDKLPGLPFENTEMRALEPSSNVSHVIGSVDLSSASLTSTSIITSNQAPTSTTLPATH